MPTQQQQQVNSKIAQVALDSGRPDTAIAIYRQQLQENPQELTLLLALSSAYNQAKEFDLALHYLQQALPLAQSLPSKSNAKAVDSQLLGSLYRERGNAQQGLGQFERAAEDFQSAVALLPNDAKTQNSLGLNYALLQDYAPARSAFIAALASQPESLEYRNNLGLAWILDNAPQQGIDVLHRHYLRGRSTVKSRQNLALAFAMKGDLESAKVIASQDLNKAELENNLMYYKSFA